MSRRRSHGFTLLEVIVAVVIFSTVMGLLVQLVAQNIRRTADARDELRMARLAEGKLREILFQAERGELPDPGTNQGTFEAEEGEIPLAFEVKVDGYSLPLPQGAPKQVVQGSGMFTGGGKPALRQVVVKVFPADSDPESMRAVPFVAFVAEPNPAAEPAPGEGGTEDQGEQSEQPEDPGIDDSSQEVTE